jgi:general secretion pathway protein D
MKTRLLIGLILALFCPFVAAEKDEFSLNLKDVDIRALIETVADATGKNFIVDPRITGNISVVTSTPMKASQVYDVFLSILKVHGYSAVPNGNIVKIIPNITAKQDGEESELRANSQNGDEQLTRIVQVHHVDASQVVQTLLPLMPQYAFLAAVPESNTIILSDTAANVNRLALMIKQIDKSDVQNIEIINLRHANAGDLIQPLNTLITSNNAGKTTAIAPPLVADERSNSIIVGGDPDLRLQLRALIANLDTPIEKSGNTEVIYMRYAVAKELVETLTGVGSQKEEKTDKPKTKAGTSKDFDIRADEAANALIITAPHDLMLTLKSVVRQLDVRRAQVHIEAIIAEVSYDKSQNIGVEWQTKDDVKGLLAAKANGNSLDIPKMISSVGKGLSIGYLAGSELKALINAFANDTDVNVLSTPSLVTMDNEEANMIVGRNIPLTTGQYTPSVGGSLSTPFQTIQREDIGIKLKVLPQISEGNAVKLKVAQEVSSVVQGTTGADLQTNKRKIETSVLVDDGKVLVLGGLIEDDITETVDKVPLLGDIPWLGYLFQSSTTTITKKNLMVFLRPQIIRDAGKSTGLTHDKYNYIRDKQQEFNRDGVLLMPDQKQPLMDDLPDSDSVAPDNNGQAGGNGN